ncbi:putative RNA-directed DNA polymerase [Tanacetum coccineum]|uniref:RNA-directed DNA polymerase n=1 Tax=Tanacetum coccineum TaxID=301880 RepID=A0ABQ5D5K3_9ASTR
MNPISNLGNAYHLVAEDECQRAISSDKRPTTEAAPFKTFVPTRREENHNQRRDKSNQKDTKRVEVVEQCTYFKDERWKEAMRKEIHELEENGTWTLEDLPDGKRAIDSNYSSNPLNCGRDERLQASLNWYHKFTTALLTLDLKQSKADHSLFIHQRNNTFVAALIYVDDVILVGNDLAKMQHTKTEIDTRFSIKDLGNLKYFLGCRPSSFPIEQNHKLDKSDDQLRFDASCYRRVAGRLLYLQATRLDIAYSVNVLSQFVVEPRQPHLDFRTSARRFSSGSARRFSSVFARRFNKTSLQGDLTSIQYKAIYQPSVQGELAIPRQGELTVFQGKAN